MHSLREEYIGVRFMWPILKFSMWKKKFARAAYQRITSIQ